jgi:hypothetical protein
MGMMLSEQGITDMLQGLGQHLRQRNADQAEICLDGLSFERLLRPIEDPTRRLHFIDPAEPFGVERVHETGEYLRRCRSALTRRDLEYALVSAEHALERWRRLEKH